jgi:hypothetical protein
MRGKSFVKAFPKIAAFAAWQIAVVWLMPAFGLAATTAEKQAARRPGDAELVFEGRPVEEITLVDERGQVREIVRPEARVFLPPGRYQIREICVRWDTDGPASTERDVAAVVLDRAKPCRLNVASPQTPVLGVKRAGRLLQLSYDPRAADAVYRDAPRDIRPQFAVYHHGQKIGSGSFEYG